MNETTGPQPPVGISHEGFHALGGWYFNRQPDGSVKISAAVHRCVEEVTIDPDTWASIMAAMSAAGETAVRWHQAWEFHSQGGA